MSSEISYRLITALDNDLESKGVGFKLLVGIHTLSPDSAKKKNDKQEQNN